MKRSAKVETDNGSMFESRDLKKQRQWAWKEWRRAKCGKGAEDEERELVERESYVAKSLMDSEN